MPTEHPESNPDSVLRDERYEAARPYNPEQFTDRARFHFKRRDGWSMTRRDPNQMASEVIDIADSAPVQVSSNDLLVPTNWSVVRRSYRKVKVVTTTYCDGQRPRVDYYYEEV